MPEMSKMLIFPRENQRFAHFWHGRFRLIPLSGSVLVLILKSTGRKSRDLSTHDQSKTMRQQICRSKMFYWAQTGTIVILVGSLREMRLVERPIIS